jgi:hypothetical protein
MSTVGNWRGPNIVKDGLVFYIDAGSNNSYYPPSAGVAWNDISGNGYNCTLTNGPTYSSLNGGSIVFDGSDDRVSRTGNVNTGQNFTVNTWIYPTLLGTTRRAVVSNAYPSAGARTGWFFSTAGGNTNNTFFISIGQDNAYRVAAANTLSLNTWQHITAVVTGGGSTITLYLNGNTTSTALSSLTSGTILYTDTVFNIGYRTAGSPDPYTGRIAHTTIYNRDLSQTEVQQNFNATRTRFGV